MDSSTDSQCMQMEMAIGGATEMVSITGSKCYPRFSGPQIRKIYQQRTNAYENTARITIISSFLASIFLGEIAPIDYADGSGMNLFDINEKTWSKMCLNACAPDLASRLGEPVATLSIIGSVSKYFEQRFGFQENCKIAAFTGDNPSALSGMLTDRNWLVVSLGTSDTIMMNLTKQPKLEEGHVLCHPTDRNCFMGLLCFRNGSLVRDAINKTEANGDWKTFNELLDSTPRGNFGNMAIHFHDTEIIPQVKGVLKWNKEISSACKEAFIGVKKFSSPQTEIRALIEGQILHHKAVATDMGFGFGKDNKIIATGGASVNKSILQVMADVFNAPVYIQKSSEAALIGAAYRAKYVLHLENGKSDAEHQTLNYQDYIKEFIPDHLELICEPSKDSEIIYNPMLERYREMCRALEKIEKQF